jgi:predicted methyltransferase
VDLRLCVNLISDIANNRPRPIRELDQIYMKHADMLLQIEHISKWFARKSVVFVGDGDAIALGLAYLQFKGALDSTVRSIRVLDFDERIVNSVCGFSTKHGLQSLISAELYNVADAIPPALWRRFDCFYCNPPFGAANGGMSVRSFMRRGFEATGEKAIGCVVVADAPQHPWAEEVLHSTQKFALENGFVVAEMVPGFHTYHLDDEPDLKSCSLTLRRIHSLHAGGYDSVPLNGGELDNFYGDGKPLIYERVSDCSDTEGAKDYNLIPRKGRV